MPLPTDPFLASQWHLGNTGGLLDLRVRGVWNPTSGAAYTGAGTRVAVIGDGFDYNHSDLALPYDEALDFDFADSDSDPYGVPESDGIGTAVAGLIAADDNGAGAVGVAFDASLVGYRVGWLFAQFFPNTRDAIQSAAFSAQADVANLSIDWLSPGLAFFQSASIDELKTSIGTAIDQGRGELGMTIVKAAGDDFMPGDVNALDSANDTQQVIVGAVDQNGFVSSLSSYGAALLVSAFGTPGEVVTTDRVGAPGYNNTDFTAEFFTTSAAAAMVTGVVSLIYDANPNLGWRDVQTILAYSARHVGSAVDGVSMAGSERHLWQWNGANTWNGGGLHFSNDYGYGLVDALAAVRLAETWLDTVPFQNTWNEFPNAVDMLNATVVVPDGNAAGTTFSGSVGFNDEVERVTVTVTFSSTATGDMEVYVTSPDGTVSELIDDAGGTGDFNGTWTFETQAFRGERAAGTWSVRIVDDQAGNALSVSNVVLRTRGRAGTDDRYVFTDEYATYAGIGGHSTVLTDTNGGTDSVNAAAVTSNSTINLNGGSPGAIAGRSFMIAAGTMIENAYGGDGHDAITGNAVGNRLLGGRGNDSLDGGGGTDSLFGGAGDDTLVQNSGAPNEVLDGGDGNDTGDWSFSGDGWVISLGGGQATIGGTVYGQLTSIENVIGASGNDTIFGNGVANTLDGGAGNDWIYGGGDADTFLGGDGSDALNGGVGADDMSGGAGADNLFGGDGNDTLRGGDDDDYLVGGNGTNTMSGDKGADSLNDGVGDGYLSGGDGNDGLFGGDGNDSLNGDGDDDYIVGGNGMNSLFGGGGVDSLNDGDGNGYLVGGAGDDGMFGGFGADQFFSGAGFDWMVGGNGADLFVFASGDGGDAIADFNVIEDRVNLAAVAGIDTFADVEARMSFNGSNTVIDFGGGDRITFIGVRPETLTAEQFYI